AAAVAPVAVTSQISSSVTESELAKPAETAPADPTKTIIDIAELEQLRSAAVKLQEVESKPVVAEPVITVDSIKQMAPSFGLITITQDEMSEFVAKSEELEHLKSVPVPAAAIVEPVVAKSAATAAPALATVASVTAAAASLGLSIIPTASKSVEVPKLTTEELTRQASNLGLATIPIQQYQTQVEELNKLSDADYLSERLGKSGLTVVKLDTMRELDELREFKNSESQVEREITESDIKEKSHALGLVTISVAEFEELNKRKAAEEQEEENHQPGLITPEPSAPATEVGNTSTSTSAAAAAVAAADLTKDQLIELSSKFGLVTVPASEYDSMVQSSEVQEQEQEQEQPPFTKDELTEQAKGLGLLAIPESAFVATNVSRIPDVNNVVVLPVTYYNKLSRSQEPPAPTSAKLTDEELQEMAKTRGYVLVSEGDHYQATRGATPQPPSLPQSHHNRSSSVYLTTIDSRKAHLDNSSHLVQQEFQDQQSMIRLSRASSKAQQASSIHGHGQPTPYSFRAPSIPGTSSATVSSENSPVAGALTSQTGNHSPQLPQLPMMPGTRDGSINGGFSLLTNASLTSPNIIPALTQTVIGEFLFKYYRRLGPFSSISESRHERYFWIHPYTLTLYWSVTNPVLGNPSSGKTRAAAIIAVESVEDNNPLPTGLYHRSIIVHSQGGKSVKFTCPTRQRHNIWFNSLRYLVSKSMEGLDFDEGELDVLGN
ncbi:hypothetical protein WICPIJ_003523, partial [Wickerhamomyces pijperi]